MRSQLIERSEARIPLPLGARWWRVGPAALLFSAPSVDAKSALHEQTVVGESHLVGASDADLPSKLAHKVEPIETNPGQSDWACSGELTEQMEPV